MWAHDLRCPTNPFQPQYVGYCERCNQKVYYDNLRFQYEFRGQSLVNTRILVCSRCEDHPQENVRPIIIGPDSQPPTPRPTATHIAEQMLGTGLTAPPSPQTQLAVLRDDQLI
jgi:hypothetical protein